MELGIDASTMRVFCNEWVWHWSGMYAHINTHKNCCRMRKQMASSFLAGSYTIQGDVLVEQDAAIALLRPYFDKIAFAIVRDRKSVV